MEACNGQFQRGGTDNIIQSSEDNQMTIGSLTDPIPTTNIPLLNKLNTKVKEPSKLIFFHGAMFEETINIKDQRGYSQSCILQGNKALELEFKQIAGDNLMFADNWGSDIIDANIQRMYSKHKPAQEASN